MGHKLRFAFAIALTTSALLLWLALRGTDDSRAPFALESAPVADVARADALDPEDRVLRREDPSASRSETPTNAPASGGARDLVVRVLDASGQPVDDVSVELWTALAVVNEREMWQLYSSAFSAQGDLPQHGMRVPAEALEEAFAKAREAREAGREVRVLLCAPGSFVTCTSYEFAVLETPTRDVELALEPNGFLRIEALQPDAKPYTGRASVSVKSVAPSGEMAERRHPGSSADVARSIELPSAGLRVHLGGSLHVSVHVGIAFEFLGHREELLGPSAEGDEVVLRFQLRLARMLVGRLLTSAGAPLANQQILLCFELAHGRFGQSSGRTDAEGRFRVALQGDPPTRRIEMLRIFPIEVNTRRWDPAVLENHPHASKEHLDLPESAVADLGDLDLVPSTKHFLASGLVVDLADTPIEGADVRARTGTSGQLLDNAQIVSDHVGRFEIYSLERVSSLHLVAKKTGFFFERSVEALAGETEVRLVLHRGAAIEGTVRVPEGFPLSSLQVHRLFEGGTQATLTPQPDGTFRFDGCAPGAHALAFQLAPWKPLLELSGLAVAGEERCADLRLREVDLRRLVSTLRIRALDVGGDPLAERSLRLSRDGSQALARELRTDASGRAAIGLPFEVQAVAIALPGGVPAVVVCSEREHELRLAEPLTLELALDPAPSLPEDVRLSACLELLDPSGAPTRPALFTSTEKPFREGRAEHRVPLEGRYALRWVASTTDAQAYRATLHVSEPSVIDVASRAKGQRIAVSPPADALRAALAKLGR